MNYNNLAIIDIGSNSVKLVLAEAKTNGDSSFKIIDELKETVRLGEGMDSSPYLKEDRIEAGIKTLKMFKNLCDATNTETIIPVATAAVRTAKNQADFLQRVKDEVNLRPQVLSGIEEGYYDYWGVVNSIDYQEGVIMDIGGGSIELIWMKDRRIKKQASLPFGSLNLTQRFKLQDSINSAQEGDLINFLKNEYHSISWLKEIDTKRLIGVGGTIRNIAKINKRKKDYPLDSLHYYKLTQAEVNEVYKLVKVKDLAARKKISGLSKSRADIFIGACAAVNTLIDFCSFEELLISGKGLREGLIYNYLYNGESPTDNVVDFSIRNIMQHFNLNKKHAEKVYQLTESLFKQLKPLYELDFESFNGSIDKIIKAASLLHDAGSTINYYDHHEHSFYMILNSGLNGLTHRELLITAYIAASHRHTKYSLHKYNLNRASFKQIINKKGSDKEIIRKTGILLEIAESLDRNRKGLIENVKCTITEKSVKIKVIATEDVELEINDALSVASGFKKLYNKELIITD
ncbi:exopolyphosphatase [Fuchsiella alkaliacetigena]|uniref:exopolyphosphatase n=1 Tax=Fuchsiella alkaliacetigena TaxID=957042 RepID=UPI00200B2075|nr:exopolyphosphatase [Fuchsiella alkaliacetigena]MCK8824665.1 exopolyphosphatase [Fuchsiella alkaliacetigena]